MPIAAAGLAILLANMPLETVVDALLATKLTLSFGDVGLSKALLLWINDALMVVFFLLVGLEIKREVLEGTLSELSQIAMPVAAAVGGMVVLAATYAALNWGRRYGAARLGDPGGHRHRILDRCAGGAGTAGAAGAEAVPRNTGHC